MASQKVIFKANEVSYQEANGGDIIQVSFDEEASKDQKEDSTCFSKPYFLISQCCETPGKPTTEWFDGKDFDGGANIREYRFTENTFEVNLSNGLVFSIEHACNKRVFDKIKTFLESEFPSRG